VGGKILQHGDIFFREMKSKKNMKKIVVFSGISFAIFWKLK
jgi:hypothetical protein